MTRRTDAVGHVIDDETEGTEEEFAEHMGEDCKPRALEMEDVSVIDIDIDIDTLLEHERDLQDRKRAVAKELRERAWQLREEADKHAKVLRGKAEDLEAKADLLDPPDDIGKCAGGAPRKPVVRKSRMTAEAAKPAKAPSAKAKTGKPAGGVSGVSNGAAKPARKPPPTGSSPDEAAVLGAVTAYPGYSGAEHARDNGWNGAMTSQVLRTLEASGKVRHDGEKRGTKWYPA